MKEKITKTFRRTIKTADYETIEVINSVEKEIDFSTDAEKSTIISKMREDATQQVADDLNMICDKMGIGEKRVFVKSTKPKPSFLD